MTVVSNASPLIMLSKVGVLRNFRAEHPRGALNLTATFLGLHMGCALGARNQSLKVEGVERTGLSGPKQLAARGEILPYSFRNRKKTGTDPEF